MFSARQGFFHQEVATPEYSGPFSDDSDTLLLLHLENNVTDDNSTARTAYDQSTQGSFAFSSSVVKFGSYSLGGGGIPGGWQDNVNPSTWADFDTADFTIEFWARFDASANTDQLQVGAAATGDWQVFIGFDSGFTAFGRTNIAWDVSTTTSYSADTWYHFAFVRQGANLWIWRDGSQLARTTNNAAKDFAMSYFRANFGGNAAASDYVYVDEFRISDIARYTVPFIIN